MQFCPLSYSLYNTTQIAWGSAADERARNGWNGVSSEMKHMEDQSVLLQPPGKPDLITYLWKCQYLHRQLEKVC